MPGVVPELTCCSETSFRKSKVQLELAARSNTYQMPSTRAQAATTRKRKTIEGCQRLPDLFRHAARARGKGPKSDEPTADRETISPTPTVLPGLFCRCAIWNGKI